MRPLTRARLLVIFAALDGATEAPEHFEAARAWVDVSIATIRKLFGDAGR